MSRPATPADLSSCTAVYVACVVAGVLAGYTVWSSYGQFTAYQLFFLAVSLFLSIEACIFIGREPFKNGTAADLVVAGGNCVATAVVFYPTAGNIFISEG